MPTKQFEAESKRLLEMMINSIYSQREVFLRELISNASDAIDKLYYKALTDESLTFNSKDYYIKVSADKESRTLTITDTGIGMTEEELINNLGVIARSGSLSFKKENDIKDGHDIIGQFGVGFYAAFMVADAVTVKTKALNSDQGYLWRSEGVEGYSIEPVNKTDTGTEIALTIKKSTDEDDFDQFLDVDQLKSIIVKYSDFIRYPIKMDIVTKEPQGEDQDPVEVIEEKTVNSMIPIWKKNKNELSDEDYNQFYTEKHYGFDQPLQHIHLSVDGNIRYDAILYIPESTPYNYYSAEYEKGLELYSNGVLIMNKCADLLPDYFSFVKGLVDSEDLSLNISREMLQHDRQLKLIAKNINKKIKTELQKLLKNDRDKYETFYASFGRQLKYGVYSDFGQNKETLQDLLLFYSSKENKLVSLAEYVERMPEDQPYIYYATGETNERIERLPQTEVVLDKGYEILYLTDDIDEFAIKMLATYQEKDFKSVSSGDLGFEPDEEENTEEEMKENKALLDHMKSVLADKVKDVRISKRLKSHPVCLSNDGEISIEMEKVLNMMPDNPQLKADKILEINMHHDVFKTMQTAYEKEDIQKTDLLTNILYHQALLIEGLSIDDPVTFTNNIWKAIAE
ncbi:molecular chaperone HtpG [Paraliobacillus sp. JSM ZJ581]|uniref:molecular chaperone HtpG n=1 Tax=Paraliobacillus sp. JSM ZJ581 TaxID=3342118 RepID=UPI0035A8B8C1